MPPPNQLVGYNTVMSSYPCTQCGECCRHVDRHDLSRHLDRGDGACRHLNEATLGCLIYADRPFFCDITRTHALLFAGEVSLIDFYRANATACDALQAAAGRPESYRVNVPSEMG